MSTLQFQDAPASKINEPSGVDWRDYTGILMERIWLAITVFILCLALSFVHLRRQTPVYISTARIMVEDRPTAALNIQDVLSFNRNGIESYNTHLKALYSRKMIEGALKNPALKKASGFLPSGLPEDDWVDYALGHLRIDPVPQSRLIDIVVEHTDPAMASEFANIVANQYINQDSELRSSKSTETMDWFRLQADTYRAKLEKGLLELQQYRLKNNAVSLEQDQDVVISTLKARSAALIEAGNARRLLESSWQSVALSRSDFMVLSDLPMIASDPSVLSAKTALEKKRNDVTLMAARYGPKFPEMVAAENEVRVLEQSFKLSVERAAAQIEARYKSAQAQEETLKKALREQEAEALELDRKLVGYLQIKRNVEADQQIYDGMISRMKEASLVGDMGMNYIRMVDPARPSKAPARPSPQKIILSGALLGLFLAVGLSFLVHAADNRLRHVKEVEKTLGHSVLASIPHISRNSVARQLRGRVAELRPASIPSEAFRMLRARLSLQSRERDARILLVTSVGMSDGKSLVSSNLAIVFAQDNRKTLLIDADMRRPTVHRTFECPRGRETPGLSSILSQNLAWREAVVPTAVPGLDILPSGPPPANPSELLGQSSMGALLSELSKHYDRIIMDSPPAVVVSDALVLMPRVDGIVFIVHYGKTRSSAARTAIRQMESSGTPVLGLVMDNLQISRNGVNHYYHAHSGYQYHDKDNPAPGKS